MIQNFRRLSNKIINSVSLSLFLSLSRSLLLYLVFFRANPAVVRQRDIQEKAKISKISKRCDCRQKNVVKTRRNRHRYDKIPIRTVNNLIGSIIKRPNHWFFFNVIWNNCCLFSNVYKAWLGGWAFGYLWLRGKYPKRAML